jgi:hypothetical protein
MGQNDPRNRMSDGENRLAADRRAAAIPGKSAMSSGLSDHKLDEEHPACLDEPDLDPRDRSDPAGHGRFGSDGSFGMAEGVLLHQWRAHSAFALSANMPHDDSRPEVIRAWPV